MTDAEQQSPERINEHSSRLNTTLWILGVFVVLTGCYVVLNSGPPRLREGTIVSDLGEYRSPNNDCRVQIFKTSDGNIEIVIGHSVSGFSIFRTFKDHTGQYFEHERGWFLCFDASDDLWIFNGPWKREWGEPRILQPNGRPQYAAEVARYSRGSALVISSTFDWRGVPAEFLNKIPDADESVWGANCEHLPAVKQLIPTQ